MNPRKQQLKNEFRIKLWMQDTNLSPSADSTDSTYVRDGKLDSINEWNDDWVNVCSQYKLEKIRYHYIPMIGPGQTNRGLLGICQVDKALSAPSLTLPTFIEKYRGIPKCSLKNPGRAVVMDITLDAEDRGWQDKANDSNVFARMLHSILNHNLVTSVTGGYGAFVFEIDLTIRR